MRSSGERQRPRRARRRDRGAGNAAAPGPTTGAIAGSGERQGGSAGNDGAHEGSAQDAAIPTVSICDGKANSDAAFRLPVHLAGSAVHPASTDKFCCQSPPAKVRVSSGREMLRLAHHDSAVNFPDTGKACRGCGSGFWCELKRSSAWDTDSTRGKAAGGEDLRDNVGANLSSGGSLRGTTSTTSIVHLV